MCGARAKIHGIAGLVVPDVGEVSGWSLYWFFRMRAFGVVAHAREVAIDGFAAREAVLVERLPLAPHKVRFLEFLDIQEFVVALVRELVEALRPARSISVKAVRTAPKSKKKPLSWK